MTPRDKSRYDERNKRIQENLEFLNQLDVNEEVIVTNTYNVPRYNFGNIAVNEPFDPESDMLGIGEQTEEICVKRKVRGITVDGSFVIDLNIYTKEGKPERVIKGYERTELWAPSEELEALARRLAFVRTIRNFSFYTWKQFDSVVIDDLQNMIDKEVRRINKNTKP